MLSLSERSIVSHTQLFCQYVSVISLPLNSKAIHIEFRSLTEMCVHRLVIPHFLSSQNLLFDFIFIAVGLTHTVFIARKARAGQLGFDKVLLSSSIFTISFLLYSEDIESLLNLRGVFSLFFFFSSSFDKNVSNDYLVSVDGRLTTSSSIFNVGFAALNLLTRAF